MKRRRGARDRQRGVALIIALILVALATLLATKLSFDGWLERRRTMGVLAAEQALQFGLGAEALAADALTQSAGQGAQQQTSLDQPWAQPAAPLPLTPPNDAEGEPIGSLQGSLEDLQGRFNLNNLAHLVPVGTGGGAGTLVAAPSASPGAGGGFQLDPLPLEQFQRLLSLVKLEPKWAAIARDWITSTDQASSPDGAKDSIYTSQTPPYRTGLYQMTSPTELMNMVGFGADRYRLIAPYVTALPTATAQINICTAPWQVLESIAPNLNGEYENPDLLVNGRKTGCFPEPTAFTNILGANAGKYGSTFATQSSYFRLTTRVVLGTTQFTVYSLLYRPGGGKVTPLLRTFGTL